MAGFRRFSQAISEGDGISLIVDVENVDDAREARTLGAEAVALRGAVAGLHEATELPSLWCASDSPEEAHEAGADAFLLVGLGENDLHEVHGRALELGLDCVVEVRDEDELELVLEQVDPEILLLTGDERESALSLLPDVPAGKLAIADARGATSDEIAELERAGVDAVLVGHALPS